MKQFLLIAALASCLSASGCYSGTRPAHIGNAAKQFTVQDSDRKVSLEQFQGQVVVLNFWATWCPPCQEELPSLMTMQERMRGRGIVVVGVSIDVDGNAYHSFLKEHGVNFLTVRDPQQKVAELYGTSGWPESYIIDRQGILRRKIVGPIDWTQPDIIQLLGKL